jgi:hypothetical protein
MSNKEPDWETVAEQAQSTIAIYNLSGPARLPAGMCLR